MVSVVAAKMLRPHNFLILHLFYFILSTSIRLTDAKYEFPRDRGLSCGGCDRYTPMALDSSKARPISVPSFRINISKNAKLNSTNVGTTVQQQLVEGSISCTGGPLYNDVYNFLISLYHADGVPQFTRSLGLRDGRGEPVCHEFTFLKEGLTELEAYSHPNGFLSMIICVEVEGEIDNTKFDKYAKVLRATRTYNSSTISSAHDLYDWLFETLPNNCYYSFPGSRQDPVTIGIDPVAIWIYPSTKIRPTISFRQFQEYLEVLNPVGQPLVGPYPCYEQGNRQVVEICDPVIVHYSKHCS